MYYYRLKGNKMNPYQVVQDFEREMAKFVGSPYAVAVDSCTNAIFLACTYLKVDEVTLPNKTYVSVPCSVIHAGGKVKFEDYEWQGSYQLKPYPIYDSACQLFKKMYIPNTHQCISFSGNKPLNIGKGGMIFTDDADAVKWYKKARYEGRAEVGIMEDHFDMLGWNMYMTPEQAARGLVLLSHVKPRIHTPTYPDLSKYEIYTKANR
jgi:dTDP-4-amino-4,6-dideoxygalactose transaminase